MKTKYLLFALPLALLSACSSTVQKNAGAFLGTVAAMDITANDVTQKTTGPFYNHAESITAFTKTQTGFSVSKLSAEFNIPLPVFGTPLLHWEITANAIAGTSQQKVSQALQQMASAPKSSTSP